MNARGFALDRVQGVAINDPFVLAMAVHGSEEPMVDLRELPLRIDASHADDEGLFALTRRSVAERLIQAQALLPEDVHLLIVEGYRPPELQQRYFDAHLAELTQAHPDWDLPRLRTQASLHVAPPDVAPHSAGGAIDLTLCDPDGRELDLGTSINATPEESDNRCFTVHPRLEPEPRANRNTLCQVMALAGFVNYGPEWWHWSFGDRYWAMRLGAAAAVYDVVPIEQARAQLQR